MKNRKLDPDRLLDRAVGQIRNEMIDPAVTRTAAERVWARLSRESRPEAAEAERHEADAIRSCDDFQSLIPAYLDGELSRGRVLLLEDHTRQCVPCRKALKRARSERAGAPAGDTAAPARRSYWGWALAGGLAAAVFIGGILFGLRYDIGSVFLLETGGQVLIGAVDGALYEISGEELRPVAEGASLERGERVRTAKGSGAVLELADGSLVEMNERTELHVTRRGRDATVHLARGSIIVEASERGSGHLYTKTDDCLVSVTGTVFSVNRGTKGSRVSVIEGEVHVDRGSKSDVLRPGDQVSTNPRLAAVPVEEEIAWSRDAERHIALLRELAEFRRELDERLPRPELRHSTRLLDAAPEGTVLFAAFPNLTPALAEAHRLFRERIETSEVLQGWWSEVGDEVDPQLETAVDKIRSFGETLGEEIAVALQKVDGDIRPPLLMAELRDAEGFRTLLTRELESIEIDDDREPPVRLLDNPFEAGVTPVDARSGDQVLFWIHDDLLLLSFDRAQLQTMASALGTPGSSRFPDSSFHGRLADAYRDGVNWLFGADLGSILAMTEEAGDADVLEKMGIMDVEHLIVERHETEDKKSVTHASLSFSQERRGIASWLAEPAPMGALDFVSADATAATAFVVRNPASMLSELLTGLDELPDTESELRRIEDELGVDLVNDVAAPLGGEIAFALDGPVLPKPAWKLVVEVYDPEGLQRTVEWAVERVNATAQAEMGRDLLRLERREAAGRAYFAITSDELGTPVLYTFVDGYLVAAPQQALVDRAIEYREMGYTLPASERFTSLMPEDGRANFSAVVYQNLGPVLDPLIRSTVGRSGQLSDEQRAALALSQTEPSLFCAYGEKDSITVTGLEQGGLLGNFGKVFDLGGLAGLKSAIEAADARDAAVVD